MMYIYIFSHFSSSSSSSSSSSEDSSSSSNHGDWVEKNFSSNPNRKRKLNETRKKDHKRKRTRSGDSDRINTRKKIASPREEQGNASVGGEASLDRDAQRILTKMTNFSSEEIGIVKRLLQKKEDDDVSNKLRTENRSPSTTDAKERRRLSNTDDRYFYKEKDPRSDRDRYRR